MKALYQNRLYRVVEARAEMVLVDGERELSVPFDAKDLVIDPTDRQVAEADNLNDWCCVERMAAEDLRAMLRGDLSTEVWQSRWRR